MWRIDDVRIALSADATDYPITTIEVQIPQGTLTVMAELTAVGRTLRADGLHIHAAGIGKNDLGPAKLRRLALIAVEIMDYDQLVVAGAARTTGASPGHRPRHLRFSRIVRADD
jgi:hypothetical protein